MCVCVCVRVCGYVCADTCVRACVCVCVRVCISQCFRLIHMIHCGSPFVMLFSIFVLINHVIFFEYFLGHQCNGRCKLNWPFEDVSHA